MGDHQLRIFKFCIISSYFKESGNSSIHFRDEFLWTSKAVNWISDLDIKVSIAFQLVTPNLRGPG